MPRMTEERRLAPHVDPAWSHRFILEARLREVSGRRIGDALREVDGHCVDSGEDAEEAFGDAAGYAASLAAPGPRDPGAMARTVAPMALQSLGLMIATLAAMPLGRGEPAELTALWLSALALVAVVDLLLVFAATPLLRFAMRRPVVSWAVIVLGVVAASLAMGAIGWLLDAPVLALPAGPVLLAGLAVVGAGAVWGRAVALREGPDPLVDPEEDAPGRAERGEVAGDARGEASAQTAVRIYSLLIPLATVALCAGLWAIGWAS